MIYSRLCSSSFKMTCGFNNTLFGSSEDRVVCSFVIRSLRGGDKHFDTYPLLSRTPRSLIPQSLTARVLTNHLSRCPYEINPASLGRAKWTSSHENRWETSGAFHIHFMLALDLKWHHQNTWCVTFEYKELTHVFHVLKTHFNVQIANAAFDAIVISW